MIFLAIAALAALAFWLRPPPAPQSASRPACLNNLLQIHGAKEQWAMENKASEGAPVDPAAVNQFIKGGPPICSSGGTYSYNPIGTVPACSWQGPAGAKHALDKNANPIWGP
jgi:hypothetical protein